MPRSTTASAAWPDPLHLAARLLASFMVVLALSWYAGRVLIDAMMPLAHAAFLWMDDSFAIVFLGLDHNGQDTVVRLRVNQVRWLVAGNTALEPQPGGWLQITTPVGTLLQAPLVALGLAGAWPGPARALLLRVGVASLLALLFLLIDIPLSLYALVLESFTWHFDRDAISPLFMVHGSLQSGGRLAVGVLICIVAVLAVARSRPSWSIPRPG